jgi:outer membrane protein insertion porin family
VQRDSGSGELACPDREPLPFDIAGQEAELGCVGAAPGVTGAHRGERRIDARPEVDDPLPFGGNVLIQGGAEILFPLPFVKDQRSLRTSVFWDVGNVFDSKCDQITNPSGVKSKTQCNDVSLSNLASSVGVGVTWVTALGPLSFALAMPIKKPDNAETQIFQFSLGQTF